MTDLKRVLAPCSLLLALLMLAACNAAAPAPIAVEPVVSTARVKTSADTIAIGRVSLPAYAKETAIKVQDAQGTIKKLPNADWADEPDRALSNSLVRNLSAITGAKVAGDPWPLGGIPEAEVAVNVETMIVDATNTMRLAGQFTIRRDRATSRNRIETFDIRLPAAERTPRAVVAAHGEAWRDLAERIARAL